MFIELTDSHIEGEKVLVPIQNIAAIQVVTEQDNGKEIKTTLVHFKETISDDDDSEWNCFEVLETPSEIAEMLDVKVSPGTLIIRSKNTRRRF